MDDPAYKQLFSRPRMVEDLLHGFAARRLERRPRLRLPRSAPGQLCQPRSAAAPGGNLVSALIALETSRDRERLPELLGSLIGLLREQGDEELTQAFRSCAFR